MLKPRTHTTLTVIAIVWFAIIGSSSVRAQDMAKTIADIAVQLFMAYDDAKKDQDNLDQIGNLLIERFSNDLKSNTKIDNSDKEIFYSYSKVSLQKNGEPKYSASGALIVMQKKVVFLTSRSHNSYTKIKEIEIEINDIKDTQVIGRWVGTYYLDFTKYDGDNYNITLLNADYGSSDKQEHTNLMGLLNQKWRSNAWSGFFKLLGSSSKTTENESSIK